MLIYDESNILKDEFIISSAYMKWIDLDIVIGGRQLYQNKKNVQYQLHPFNSVIDIKFIVNIIPVTLNNHAVDRSTGMILLPHCQ